WSYSRPDAGKVGTPHLQTHASLRGRRAWWGARRHGGGYGGMEKKNLKKELFEAMFGNQLSRASSFRGSLKALEADISHANAL
ncbi:hypothetical protein GW17_00059324, partial [Ensete ventricosum]